jgi:hypothetical protein
MGQYPSFINDPECGHVPNICTPVEYTPNEHQNRYQGNEQAYLPGFFASPSKCDDRANDKEYEQ